MLKNIETYIFRGVKKLNLNLSCSADASLAYAQSIQGTATALRTLFRETLADQMTALVGILENDCSTEEGPDEVSRFPDSLSNDCHVN